MRVLVIGGTTFIGREIANRLVARGHDVAVLHRRRDHDLGHGVRNVQADRGDIPMLAAAIKRARPEAVFDIAYDWDNGTMAPEVEAAARSCGDRLERYVFMSSVAAYSPGSNHGEDDSGCTLPTWPKRACYRSAEGISGQAFNIAHEPITQRDFVELLALVAGAEAELAALHC